MELGVPDPNYQAQTAKPYHAKRAHKKSRAGCRTCKSRKVKCDEVRPSCRNCVLRKTHCVYNQPLSSSSPSSSSSTSPPGHDYTTPDSSTSDALAVLPRRSRASRPRRPPKPADQVISVDRSIEYRHTGADTTDMKLMWWYSTHSYNSFATGWGQPQRTQKILQVEVPRHAFTSPFLMDIILGLAACHMQSEGQKDISARRVVAYRARAFAGYRRAVEERRPETYPGLLAGALMLTAVSSQTFRDDVSEGVVAGAGVGDLYILDWMVVWRGIGAVINLVTPEGLYDVGMTELFFRPSLDLQAATAYIPPYLLRLLSSLRESDPEYPYRETYFQGLRYLGVLYQELREDGMGPVLYLEIASWFTFLPSQFVAVARARQPLALVIIAHYLVFVKLIDIAWWLRGIADREIRGIKRFLNSTVTAGEVRWRNAMLVPDAALGFVDIPDLAGLLVAEPGWTLPCVPVHPAEMERAGWVGDDGKSLAMDDALSATCSNHWPDVDPVWGAEVEQLLQNYEALGLEAGPGGRVE